MHSLPRLLLLIACGVAAGFAVRTVAAAEPAPYVAIFADGTRSAAPQIATWHDTAAVPTIDGRQLFDASNPARWVIGGPTAAATADGRPPLPPGEEPVAFVEFIGGDRLPGTVVEHRTGTENWSERLPPHLIVKPSAAVDPPGQPLRDGVRVASERLRRVVWSRRGGRPPEPNTVRLVDGRDLPFRSLRWSGRSVLLLMDRETQRIPFEGIAEISLATRDRWDAWYHAVAMLTPDATARLFRVETAEGLVATTSPERFRASGAANVPPSWVHALQPAWSLDLLWLPHPAIRRRVICAPHEVPLSMVEPSGVEREATFGGSWTCRVDRNVQGGLLAANGLPFGTGYGVQARCELSFPLPEIVTAFRTAVGIDAAADPGGCVKAAVRAGSSAPLWESGYLVGSREVVETGTLAIAGPAGGQESLVLVADAAHDGRPSGADPYDIRDLVDWLDPVLSLDPVRLAGLVAGRLADTIPAWREWEVEADGGLVVRNVVDPSQAPALAGFTRHTIARGGETRLDRSWTVRPDEKFLVVAVSRTGATASRIEIRIDGHRVAAADVPERKPGGVVQPLLLPLDPWLGRTIHVEVIHHPTDDKSLVEWQALGPTGPLGTQWQPVEIVAAASEGKSTLTPLDDGSLLAGGPSRPTDVHSITLRSDRTGITALRLEPLGDDSLPGGGPGRGPNGGFSLGAVEAAASLAGGPSQPLAFARAEATLVETGGPELVVDTDPRTGWVLTAKSLPRQPALFLVLAKPLVFEGTAEIALTLRFPVGQQAVLGRYRITATNDPEPRVGLPGLVLETIAKPGASR